MVPTTALRINSKIKLAIAKYYSFNVFFCETKQISIKADKLCIQPGIKNKKKLYPDPNQNDLDFCLTSFSNNKFSHLS